MEVFVVIQTLAGVTLGFFGVLTLGLIVYELRRINTALRRKNDRAE